MGIKVPKYDADIQLGGDGVTNARKDFDLMIKAPITLRDDDDDGKDGKYGDAGDETRDTTTTRDIQTPSQTQPIVIQTLDIT